MRYLAAQDLPFTWDNPDIQVLDGETVVDPHRLKPATTYQVCARVHNGSFDAPAVGLRVHCSYLSFGAGTVKHPVGDTAVDLGVRGSADEPCLAYIPWTTPPDPEGHFCLQIELEWPDDANPQNNLGQLNTDVQALNSPRATFRFSLRNPFDAPITVDLVPDGYALADRQPCIDAPARAPEMSADERAERLTRARREHDPRRQGVPDGWTVSIEPVRPQLGAGEEIEVTAAVVAPEGFSGRQPINVNARVAGGLLGGVTLYADGEA